MNPGEKLFKFLAGLILDKFYGSVTIKFEHGKVTHVETEARRHWEYGDLPCSLQTDSRRSPGQSVNI